MPILRGKFATTRFLKLSYCKFLSCKSKIKHLCQPRWVKFERRRGRITLTACDYRFGWTNASFSYGLSKIKHDALMMKALGLLVPYDDLKRKQ